MRKILLIATAVVSVVHGLGSAPQVPSEFQDLHDELYLAISDFRQTVAQSWDGTLSPVAFSANLLAANSAGGPDLLSPTRRESILQEIDGLKALGVKAVSLDVSFPVLHPSFHATAGEYQQYLDFYVQVAQDVRSRGLKLIVETQALFTQGVLLHWDAAPYYASLTLEEYRQQRMEMVRTVATSLRPDYLSVIQEPDTEAQQTGKPELATVDGSRALLDTILSGLAGAPREGIAVGAGFGTWQLDYSSFAHSFASTSIDFLDMHVFPVNRDYLARAVEIADIAGSYGKQVGMTETWLYKVRETELDILDFATLFSRDVFGFWAPLDGLYLRTMVEFAHYKGLAFMSPFWSGYFRAYVEYNDATKALSAADLTLLAQAEQSASWLAGTYSYTGIEYKNAIVDPADVVPPSMVPGLQATLTSTTSAALTWQPAPDNIGTAAYIVFRDGVMIGRTGTTNFLDSGLSEAESYVYSVVALDASGNASAPASAPVTVPDVTAPSIPSGLTAAAVVSGPEITINISWQPSSDNVGVARYRLYRGASPDDLSVIATPVDPAFSIANAPPERTFFFAVSAVDASFNDSGVSPAVSVTTPSIPDTTAPIVKVVYPRAGSSVSGSTDLFALVYDVRGGLFDVPSGPAAARFAIDGVPIGDEQTTPYGGTAQYSVYRVSVDLGPLPAGEHAITALGRDKAGNTAVSAEVPVTVVQR